MFWRRSTWRWSLTSTTEAVPCLLIHMLQYVCLQLLGDSVDPRGNRDACGFVSSRLLAKLRWSSSSYLTRRLQLPRFGVTHLCTITKSIVNHLIKLQTFQFTFFIGSDKDWPELSIVISENIQERMWYICIFLNLESNQIFCFGKLKGCQCL